MKLKPKKFIIRKGMILKYTGDDHPGIRGLLVCVIKPLLDYDGKAGDCWEVAPWNHAKGRFSFVTNDARAVDLVPTTAWESLPAGHQEDRMNESNTRTADESSDRSGD